jgi:mono/diheme cytochrome c family protein
MKRVKKSINIAAAVAVALSMGLASGMAAAVDCDDEDLIKKVQKKEYKKKCKKCHGKKGNGKGPGAKGMDPMPPDWTAGTDKSDADLIKITMEGSPDTEMKGWAEGTAKKGKHVSQEAAEALVCIIRNFKK